MAPHMPENEGSRSGDQGPKVDDLLRRYVGLADVTARTQFLREHPELLNRDAEERLSAIASIQRTESARVLLEGFCSELKACREQGIEKGMADHPPTDPARAALINAISELMAAGSFEAMKAVIRQNTMLLSPEADAVLQQTGDERTARHMERYRQLLARCRQVGVEAAFLEVERQSREPALPREVAEEFFNFITAKSLGELEQALRREPRLVQAQFRTLFAAFVAQNNRFGLPAEHLQQCFALLEECDRHGIDSTLARLRPPPAANADATNALNSAIRKFNAGVNPAEVWRETAALIPHLPDLPRRSCMLLSLVTAQRAGQHAQARTLAVQLNREVSGWDLPGIPEESLGVAVKERRDVAPVLEAIDVLLQAKGIPREEEEAVQSLRQQYAQRQPGAGR